MTWNLEQTFSSTNVTNFFERFEGPPSELVMKVTHLMRKIAIYRFSYFEGFWILCCGISIALGDEVVSRIGPIIVWCLVLVKTKENRFKTDQSPLGTKS